MAHGVGQDQNVSTGISVNSRKGGLPVQPEKTIGGVEAVIPVQPGTSQELLPGETHPDGEETLYERVYRQAQANLWEREKVKKLADQPISKGKPPASNEEITIGQDGMKMAVSPSDDDFEATDESSGCESDPEDGINSAQDSVSGSSSRAESSSEDEASTSSDGSGLTSSDEEPPPPRKSLNEFNHRNCPYTVYTFFWV